MGAAHTRPKADPADLPLESFDVANPWLYRDDSWRPWFARLRAEDPVHFCPDSPYGPYWSVTLMRDAMQVELDPATYSSASELGGIQVRDQPQGMSLPNFIRMDPPKHTAHRRTVAPIAAPGHLAGFEALIRERTQAVLDALPRGEAFDWVDRVSTDLTAMMLATLFDFPQAERRRLSRWSDVAVADIGAPDAAVASEEARFAELKEMAAAMAELWKERAAAPPRFDLISMLAHGEETRAMPPLEFMGTMGLLIVGGNDTTRNTMTGGLLALLENPDEFARLRADPSLVPSMVAESIRWQTAVLHMRRTARRDAELGGKRIRAGDKVVMWYVSANRDETAFAEPDAFRLGRPNARRHIAFGAGIHRCVGDRLAELQLRVLWEEVLARGFVFEPAGAPERHYSNFIRGFKSMPVRIVASA